MKKSKKEINKKILNYVCRNCGTTIPSDTKGVFTSCKCGKMSIDGTTFYTRIIGNVDEIDQVSEEVETFVYRIKQVKSGKFFVPRRSAVSPHFSPVGKFYGRKPSLSWISHEHGKCVVEKYSIKRV